jgi:hypothetical protein
MIEIGCIFLHTEIKLLEVNLIRGSYMKPFAVCKGGPVSFSAHAAHFFRRNADFYIPRQVCITYKLYFNFASN